MCPHFPAVLPTKQQRIRNTWPEKKGYCHFWWNPAKPPFFTLTKVQHEQLPVSHPCLVWSVDCIRHVSRLTPREKAQSCLVMVFGTSVERNGSIRKPQFRTHLISKLKLLDDTKSNDQILRVCSLNLPLFLYRSVGYLLEQLLEVGHRNSEDPSRLISASKDLQYHRWLYSIRHGFRHILWV